MIASPPRAWYWRLLLAFLLLDVLLLSPEFVWAGFPPHHWVALEASLTLGVLAMLPPFRGHRALTGAVSLFAVILVLCAIGDALMQRMQGRSLNLYTDLGLLPILIELLVANLGLTLTIVGLVALGLALLTTAQALNSLLRDVHRRAVPWPVGVLLALLSAAGIARLEAVPGGSDGWADRFGQPAVGFVAFEWDRALETRRALASFGRLLENAPVDSRPLPGLANRDVIVGFIESYGVAAIERAPFAAEIRPRLDTLAQQLSDAGMSVVTGRITAATLGGQSWLNHATFLSGLPVTSQLRFELMLDSRRSTLIDDFEATGHITTAIMPGILRDWPEGRRYGYDEIRTADRMHYRGPRLGWASMPDQFTWQRVQDYALAAHDRPTFTELATLSSHAPWSPVIELIDADTPLDDGAAFERWRGVGDDYASLWQNAQAMRDNYAPAIDYALQAAGAFATAHVDAQTLLMVLGDHQAAPAIVGDNPGRDVPLHVISGDPTLLEGFRDAGFRPGMIPPGPKQAMPMADLRGLLHRLYGNAASGTRKAAAADDS
ncbi:hypothetical protein [Salinicola avicenniae]|uniref:hypothetical protein n=1 Tax=Salinicola avicenniae TaxID=2916836 RepID=UPI002072A89E|nr:MULTISPECIES: hypothetical protein [unclassified Salinicola]